MSIAMPRCCFTISEARKITLNEITASTGRAATRTTPNVAGPSVMVWATVNAVMVFSSSDVPPNDQQRRGERQNGDESTSMRAPALFW